MANITINSNTAFSKEKDIYKYLQKNVFDKYLKIYSMVLKGFPDYIVISLKDEYKDILKPGFYEVKLNSDLSVYQKEILGKLSEAFPVYVVKGDKQGIINITHYHPLR